MASTKITVDNSKKLALAASACNVEVVESLDYGSTATVEVKFKSAADLFNMGRLYNSEITEPKKVIAANPTK